ncbi:MAG: methyltransferase domain-containing protein [Microcoleus sp. CSU_2_2]|nr:methyltransferase domain-containing protein [Microcoleus sp. SU_5_3]NJS09922.1 methyltransferase domain-containing protein [Microcoleus sp. CSU_2_2]
MYSDPVQKEYSRLAERYDSRWSFYVNATIGETLNRLEINPGERILDLGCGTGALIQRLLQMAPEIQVFGIDPCAEMLEIAKQKLSKSVDLNLGSADNLPFPSNYFDVVVSTSAFHFFRDPSQAIQEAKRVLKPNGRLVITDWCDDYLTCKVCDFFLRCFNRAHFRTYGVAEFQTMMQDEGFQRVAIERYKINWFWGMMTAKAVKETSAK